MFFLLLCSFPLLLFLGCLWQKTASLPSPVLLWDRPVNHSWRHPDNMYVKISNGTQRQRVTAEALKVAVALRDSQRSVDGKQTRKQQCGGKSERESETGRKRDKLKLKAKLWRMWVLMMGIGITFSLGVSIVFLIWLKLPWVELWVFQGLCWRPVPASVQGQWSLSPAPLRLP